MHLAPAHSSSKSEKTVLFIQTAEKKSQGKMKSNSENRRQEFKTKSKSLREKTQELQEKVHGTASVSQSKSTGNRENFEKSRLALAFLSLLLFIFPPTFQRLFEMKSAVFSLLLLLCAGAKCMTIHHYYYYYNVCP